MAVVPSPSSLAEYNEEMMAAKYRASSILAIITGLLSVAVGAASVH